ncbi:hypothetical protein HK100_000646 [Physocladia obscura]|uniref:Beta-lactamase-related domain-containing protein n=1 Tax=Physocladia obscura TaxID=109957 RepID=A0AAD5TAB2_9FUNG|nr:hypothetical protein HK100_000646 [Physocladia obscura]
MKNLNLREIEKNIEDAQKQFNVRGLALGIVRESGLAYVNGYGERNSKGDPVSGRTLFQIGSTTKAFTAFAIAALVDDGFLSWDSPVANLSDIEFEFNDPVVQTFANMLDLLSHRSGLPRHDLLFFIWPSLQNIYSKLRVLPPSPFQLRQKFHYNNICYNLAGDIAGSIFERHVKENGADFLTSAWARLVHNKILGPLEMLDTRTESAGMLNTANCAEGFRYDEEKERFVLYDVDSAYRVRGARPAGSMVSNIYDLAKWVSLMLRKGVLEDGKTRLLSKLNFEKLITPHMTYGKPVSDGPIQLESCMLFKLNFIEYLLC